LWGMYAWTLCGSFPCDSPPKSVSKGTRFWGFPRFWESGVLGGNPLIPLYSTSFGGPNRDAHEVLLASPKVLCESVEWIGRSGSGFEGVDPQLDVHPEQPRPDRSDRCMWPVWPVQGSYWIYLGLTAWFVWLWAVVLLVSSWQVSRCFA
jgi:hypothetical protein